MKNQNNLSAYRSKQESLVITSQQYAGILSRIPQLEIRVSDEEIKDAS